MSTPIWESTFDSHPFIEINIEFLSSMGINLFSILKQESTLDSYLNMGFILCMSPDMFPKTSLPLMGINLWCPPIYGNQILIHPFFRNQPWTPILNGNQAIFHSYTGINLELLTSMRINLLSNFTWESTLNSYPQWESTYFPFLDPPPPPRVFLTPSLIRTTYDLRNQCDRTLLYNSFLYSG